MREAESIFGEAYAELESKDPVLWRRSDVVITTKLFWGGKGQNKCGLSREHIMEGMAKSLKRLKLDYVDLIYCHRPDSLTPTETIVRAMTDLLRSGKAIAWGTSKWSAQQITKAFWIARSKGLEPPQVEQPQYHIFHRKRFEKNIFPCIARLTTLQLPPGAHLPVAC
jgi:aryl-alcohol dehydrogenase-like predicted oxidoreductase